jgi:hypothetical protein
MSNDKTGFTFEGRGRVLRTDSFTSKAGKEIVTLIVECDGGKFTEIIPLKVWGRLADMARTLKPGSMVTVSGRLGGRDWNGKVFGDNVAEVVEVVGSQPEGTEAVPPADEDPGLPF